MAIAFGSTNNTSSIDFKLGSSQVAAIYQGTNFVWPGWNIFIGSGSTSLPDQATLESKLTGETIRAFQINGVNVSASSATNYNIDSNAFINNATIISYIDGGKCIDINAQAFFNCTSLATASFPQTTTLNLSAFGNCSSLVTASFPQVTNIIQNTFQNCISLKIADFPQLNTIAINAFLNCTALISAIFPQATTIGSNAFQQCSSLVTASFPSVTVVSASAFTGCTSLRLVSLPALLGTTALGGSTGDNSVFFNAATNGTGSFPTFYQTSNGGAMDGDIAYLSQSRGWLINWL